MNTRRDIVTGRFLKGGNPALVKVLPIKVSKFEKRILDTLRVYDNSFFLLAEKMYLSCIRKKERKEEYRGSFEYNMIVVIEPFLEDDNGLKLKIQSLFNSH